MGKEVSSSIEGLELCLDAFFISAFIGGKRFVPLAPGIFSQEAGEESEHFRLKNTFLTPDVKGNSIFPFELSHFTD
jgi:hypothetical protein